MARPTSALLARIHRLVQVEPHELRPLLWSFAYFFSILGGYYVLRPMRDAMGIAGGVEELHWTFTATFLAMLAAAPLYGWVTSRFPRARFLPYVYGFFVLNLLVFWALLRGEHPSVHVARAFFVWASVFNLFVVSVFWSFMADVYTNEQAKRLFGFVAAGGTIGALVGPAVAAALARHVEPAALLLVTAGALLFAMAAIRRIAALSPRGDAQRAHAEDSRPLGGGALAAIPLVLRSRYILGISLFMLLFTTASTVLYFQQAEIVRDAFASAAERTAVFAAVDLAVNALTIFLQVLVTGRVVRALGVAWTLALVPALLALGFVALGAAPVLAVIVGVQVLRRAGDYAVTRPARELLWVVLGRDEKYKAKSFVDTVVYRGGDAVSAWVYAGLRALGLGLGGVAFATVPIAGLWAGLAWWLGRRQEALAGEAARGGERWKTVSAR